MPIKFSEKQDKFYEYLMRGISSTIQMECVDGVWQAKPTVHTITYNDIIRTTTPEFRSDIFKF